MTDSKFGVENWIDLLVDMVRTIDKKLYVPYLYKDHGFPSAITKVPCALVFPEEVAMDYPDGGPDFDTWQGIIEFHLFLDVSKSHMPDITRYYTLIRTAFKANKHLNDHVHIRLRYEGGASIEVAELRYGGSDEPHLGLVAHWIARERDS